jgi:hypothetical protein
VSIAKGDGYKVQLGTPGVQVTCTGRGLAFEDIQPRGPQPAGAIIPRYVLSLTDHRLHPLRSSEGPTDGGLLLLLALPSAADAKRCAAAGIYTAQHYPGPTSTQGQNPPTVPYKMFSPVTVVINPHSPHAAGYPPGTTGESDTYIAHGHVLAIGQTYTKAQATIAEADLRQLLSQIAD